MPWEHSFGNEDIRDKSLGFLRGSKVRYCESNLDLSASVSAISLSILHLLAQPAYITAKLNPTDKALSFLPQVITQTARNFLSR